MIHRDFRYVTVRFRAGMDSRARSRLATDCHLDPALRLDMPGEDYTLVPVAVSKRHPVELRHARALAALDRHPQVIRAGRVFRHRRTLLAATDRIWVGLEPGAAGKAALATIRRGGGRLVRRHGDDYLIRLAPTAAPLEACARLAKLAAVRYAEPDHVMIGRHHASRGRSNAALFQPALATIDLAEAVRLQTIDRRTSVAIIDSGVDRRHPDLRGALTRAFDATGQGTATRPKPQDSHGTECAALVAGTGRARGVRGVAAGCGLFAVRIGFTPDGALADYVTKTSWLVAGIDWAWRHGADVLSMSFGGGPRSTPVDRAIERARTLGRGGKGCVLVAAVGNDGTARVEYPAVAAGVIGVAATRRDGRPAAFSNRGPGVDMAAPGVNLKTATVPDPAGGEPALYITDSGTSLSTPIVAGVAALILAANPELTATKVARILETTASGAKQRNHRTGAGIVNAANAVRAAR